METFLTLLARLQEQGVEPEEARISSWPISKDREREIVIRFNADDLEVALSTYEDLGRRRLTPRRSADSLTIVVEVYN